MKVYGRPKRKARIRPDNGWSKRESMIALGSVVVAAIGSLASAASTFFAWQQLDMLSRERMTPYRAILYNAKLDSYKSVISDGGDLYEDFEKLRLHAKVIVGDKPINVQTYRMGFSQAIPIMAQHRIELFASVKQTSVVWREEIVKYIDSMMRTSEIADKCYAEANFPEFAEDGHVVGMRLENADFMSGKLSGLQAPLVTKRASEINCSYDLIMQLPLRFKAALDATTDRMRKDMQADQLQSIAQ